MSAARKLLIAVVPLIAAGPLIAFGPEYRCLFIIIVLSTYWIGEILPVGVTSLLPLVMFPALHVVSSRSISQVYFKDSIVLFMSTLIMAMAVEATGLHRRIALKLLSKVGTSRPVMLFGFMAVTCFISFFVSDTACTALMCPTAVALLTSMADAAAANDVDHRQPTASSSSSSSSSASVADKLGLAKMCKSDRAFCKALLLSCAHASLIGGTAIITSTGPNLVFRENLQKRYPNADVGMTYLQWMVFAMPPMLIYLVASFVVLVCYFMGPSALWNSTPNRALNASIKKRIALMYTELGAITFAEKSVFAFFVILIAAWITRDPGFAPGWSQSLPDAAFVSDSVVGILIACLMFIWPRDPFDAVDPLRPILQWSDMKAKYSWSCTLLIGAGYAISDGVDKSGLSHLIACTMRKLFNGMQALPLQVTITTTIVIMTEFASNVSTARIFIPISLVVAESMQLHPLYLSLPTTVACSFAFMLPISTPPNAIVYDTRVITMLEMITVGFLLNICCIVITTLNMNTWTMLIFNLNSVPDTILGFNSTFSNNEC
ncbi:unnamed protein product [Caenorhabditis bovis]|uniref:Uncharacterized protein n=1 Tax=Caenorhabditis bovis TaxID=2654633 RepID=A0A8S1EKC7_9PELO|nr:unnamed protein product [Caenorhabditis bovis]